MFSFQNNRNVFFDGIHSCTLSTLIAFSVYIYFIYLWQNERNRNNHYLFNKLSKCKHHRESIFIHILDFLIHFTILRISSLWWSGAYWFCFYFFYLVAIKRDLSMYCKWLMCNIDFFFTQPSDTAYHYNSILKIIGNDCEFFSLFLKLWSKCNWFDISIVVVHSVNIGKSLQ